MQAQRINRRARRGFSLLEMMLVVVIIGILMTVVVLNLGGSIGRTKIQVTKSKMMQIKGALITYSGEYGSYPTADSMTLSSITLLPLVTTKSLEVVPLDGWKHEFVYRFPGTSGIAERPFDLFSVGEDGIPGTPDDIDIWGIDLR